MDCNIDQTKSQDYFEIITGFDLPALDLKDLNSFMVTNGLKNTANVDPNTKPIFIEITQKGDHMVIDSSDINLYGYPPLETKEFKSVEVQ